jgi:hypothetical protein
MIMIDQLIDQIGQKTDEVKELYFHLILLVTNPAIQVNLPIDQLTDKTGMKYINVNLVLSQLMLPLTTRQRILRTASLLDNVIMSVSNETILLNRINILFDPALQQDPLRLLQNLSRRKTIVAIWDGEIQGRYLTYAEPEHPEYRRYLTKELVLLSPTHVL